MRPLKDFPHHLDLLCLIRLVALNDAYGIDPYDAHRILESVASERGRAVLRNLQQTEHYLSIFCGASVPASYIDEVGPRSSGVRDGFIAGAEYRVDITDDAFDIPRLLDLAGVLAPAFLNTVGGACI
jgi:hypothetical protein